MMKENLKINKGEEEIIEIFVPITMTRRGGTAMIIVPKNADKSDDQKCFDNTMIKSIAKAHKWKVMLEEKRVSSLADIARKENLGTAYVSKVFNLNFLSPKIIERILEGTQPRSLKLQDMFVGIPDLWQEQEENWGF